VLGSLAARGQAQDRVWQIDPDKCIACGKCATECVLSPSAVKAVREYERCGYCKLCFAFFEDKRTADNAGAENQRCPTGAIRRSFVEEPYYEYVVDEPKCLGCGLCVKGCMDYGNAALILQVRHDRCVNCNQCAIAQQCPADAYVRVPADQPYLLRTRQQAQELHRMDQGVAPATKLPCECTSADEGKTEPAPSAQPEEKRPEPEADALPTLDLSGGGLTEPASKR